MNNTDKIKITNHQLFSLTSGFTCGSAILVISASITSLAKQDAWISAIITLIFGLLEIWLICFFWSRYPGRSYVEIIELIFGKCIGDVIAAAFVLFCLSSSAQVLWYIGNFLTTQAMPETPVYLIKTVFAIVIAIALLYGLEATARSFEVFIYVISFFFILSMLLVLPNARLEYLLPMFEKGIFPVLKGSLLLSSFLVFPTVVFLMLFPLHTGNSKTAKKSFIKGYLWGWFLVFASILVSISVLGSAVTANTQYPVYLLAKEINVGVLLSRFEFAVAGVWIITVLARIIIYFYAGVMGLGQLLKLGSHKKIILPLGLIMLVMSGVVYPEVTYQSQWDTFVWPLFAASFGLVLPLLMLFGHTIRNWLKRNK